jgi:hypothetical protein
VTRPSTDLNDLALIRVFRPHTWRTTTPLPAGHASLRPGIVPLGNRNERTVRVVDVQKIDIETVEHDDRL